MFENVRTQAEAYAHEVWEDVVADIAQLVSIPSVEDKEHAAPGMPWGPASRQALDAGLALCARLGLEAHNDDGYIGYADLPGAGSRQIATIAHTDVVPEGLGWTGDPYTMRRRDGYLLGRGVLDDKGPFVLSAYAIHFFKRLADETGKPLPATLRCIVGNCEETSMNDVAYYLEHHKAPDFCFSPDSSYPLICGEKGIFRGLFSSRPGLVTSDSLVAELHGGTVFNAIPGLATAQVRRPADQLDLTADGISAEQLEDGLTRISAQGVGGHAAFPENTDHAVGKLMRYLLQADLVDDGGLRAFVEMAEQLTRSYDGSALNLACADDVFGPLTLNAGVLRTHDDGSLTLSIDVRYPRAITSEALTERFTELAEKHGCMFEAHMDKTPFYMDPAMPEVQALLSAYYEIFERDDKPIVIGGGTYARKFPKAVAFGPHDLQHADPDWVGSEHGPDEGVSEEVLKRSLVTYIVAIAHLLELEEH